MSYIGKTASSATQNIFKFVPSSSATTVTGADAFGRVLSMPSNQDAVSVFLNGILLLGRGVDYSLSTSTVTFTSAYAISDEIIIITLEPFAVADMVKASTGGTFEGGTTHNGGITSTTGTFSGALVAEGGVVFNEGSNDVDFRVESNDSANMFVVDGGNNLVTLQNDSDTDYNTNQTASNTVLNLKNTTSGASNSVGLSFSTEANGEQYITAVQVSDNSRSDLTFGARNGGSRTETMRIAGDGHLLIGMQTALQSGFLSIEGQGRTRCINLDSDSSTGGLIGFFYGDSAVGNINTNGTITNYQTSSDYRLKENVSYDWDATTRLKQLKPARFNFKKDADKTLDGFLAHEVSSIVPEAISGTKDGTQDLGTIRDKDGNIEQENALEIHAKKDEGQTWTKTKTEDVYQGIDQSKLVPLLVKTIQELEARLTALEKA